MIWLKLDYYLNYIDSCTYFSVEVVMKAERKDTFQMLKM